MGIIHLVLFEFKPGTESQIIQDVCQRMLSLKDKCIHPTTNKPYIRTSVGGKDNSPEGRQNGITHAFVVEFESEEDRNYYTKEDPAHIAFVSSLGASVARAQVVDFVPGAF